MKNVYEQSFKINRDSRNVQLGHRNLVIWFTGLSGSGKSTLANEVEKRLFEQGITTYTLDGDNIRRGLNGDLDFSAEGRQENIRRIAETAKLFCDAGIVTLTSFISPFAKDREQAKAIVGPEDFVEVFVDCPIEICIKRDVKGLYRRAINGEIPEFTGINSPYETPESPDIRVDTGTRSLETSTQEVLDYLIPRLKG
ncbi:adenylyl-sulfate kinase [bacterium SCSIO 12741]|nr:adenylyl-sulfate kinase [bacterium SCSIO 12741]